MFAQDYGITKVDLEGRGEKVIIASPPPESAELAFKNYENFWFRGTEVMKLYNPLPFPTPAEMDKNEALEKLKEYRSRIMEKLKESEEKSYEDESLIKKLQNDLGELNKGIKFIEDFYNIKRN